MENESQSSYRCPLFEKYGANDDILGITKNFSSHFALGPKLQ